MGGNEDCEQEKRTRVRACVAAIINVLYRDKEKHQARCTSVSKEKTGGNSGNEGQAGSGKINEVTKDSGPRLAK